MKFVAVASLLAAGAFSVPAGLVPPFRGVGFVKRPCPWTATSDDSTKVAHNVIAVDIMVRP